jgi:hypothetical protein
MVICENSMERVDVLRSYAPIIKPLLLLSNRRKTIIASWKKLLKRLLIHCTAVRRNRGFL